MARSCGEEGRKWFDENAMMMWQGKKQRVVKKERVDWVWGSEAAVRWERDGLVELRDFATRKER